MNHCGIKDEHIHLNLIATSNLKINVESLTTNVNVIVLIDSFIKIMNKAFKTQKHNSLYADDLVIIYSVNDYRLELECKILDI